MGWSSLQISNGEFLLCLFSLICAQEDPYLGKEDVSTSASKVEAREAKRVWRGTGWDRHWYWAQGPPGYHYREKYYDLNTGHFMRVKVISGRGREMIAAGRVSDATNTQWGGSAENFFLANNLDRRTELLEQSSTWHQACRHSMRKEYPASFYWPWTKVK